METLTLDQVEVAQAGVLTGIDWAGLNGHEAKLKLPPTGACYGDASAGWADLIETLHNTQELTYLARALAV